MKNKGLFIAEAAPVKCKIINILNKKTGKKYSDWRGEYIGKEGYFHIYHHNQAETEKLVYFYPDDEGTTFRTSLGKTVEDLNSNVISLYTGNSIYSFQKL